MPLLDAFLQILFSPMALILCPDACDDLIDLRLELAGASRVYDHAKEEQHVGVPYQHAHVCGIRGQQLAANQIAEHMHKRAREYTAPGFDIYK